MFYKKGVLKNFAKFTGKHLCQSLFFNKVASLRPTTLSKKRLWHSCFPVSFAKFSRKLFYRTLLDGCFWKNQSLNAIFWKDFACPLKLTVKISFRYIVITAGIMRSWVSYTACKVSVFEVILVRIFPHSY